MCMFLHKRRNSALIVQEKVAFCKEKSSIYALRRVLFMVRFLC